MNVAAAAPAALNHPAAESNRPLIPPNRMVRINRDHAVLIAVADVVPAIETAANDASHALRNAPAALPSDAGDYCRTLPSANDAACAAAATPNNAGPRLRTAPTAAFTGPGIAKKASTALFAKPRIVIVSGFSSSPMAIAPALNPASA